MILKTFLLMNSKRRSPLFHHPAVLLLDHRRHHTPAALKQIHGHFITTGLALHTYPLSRLLPPLSAALPLPYAAAVLRRAAAPTTFLFNVLISSLASRRRTSHALLLYSHLLLPSSPNPNPHTFPSLFAACASDARYTPHGRAFHAHIIYLLSTDDPYIPASLLAFYSRIGDLPACRHLFDRIPNPDLPTWNTLISAHASSGQEALVLFRKMQSLSIQPSETTLVAIITACGSDVRQGASAYGYILRRGLDMNCIVGTALIEMHARCGKLELADQLFDDLRERDTLCYNAMLRGLAVHGHGRRAVSMFERMRREGVVVDDVTLVVVMSACAHAGLVDEGCWCFNAMRDEVGFELKVEHYGCLVDLLGRAGRVEEAEEVIRSMPMRPNAVVYRSLLGACRIHGNLEIGERALACLVGLEAGLDSGHYVLLSNMYANVGRWEDVKRVRKMMKDRGIDKTPGSSSVEMDRSVQEFVIIDDSHEERTGYVCYA